MEKVVDGIDVIVQNTETIVFLVSSQIEMTRDILIAAKQKFKSRFLAVKDTLRIEKILDRITFIKGMSLFMYQEEHLNGDESHIPIHYDEQFYDLLEDLFAIHKNDGDIQKNFSFHPISPKKYVYTVYKWMHRDRLQHNLDGFEMIISPTFIEMNSSSSSQIFSCSS